MCHIVSGDRWAGAEAQLATLLSALGRLPELSVSVILFNEGRLAEAARASGGEVLVLPESRLSFLGILRAAKQFLDGRGIGILHSHGYKSNILAALLARRCKIPFTVRTQHGRPEPFRGWRQWKYNLWQTLDRWVARHRTSRIISVSAELQPYLERLAAPGRVALIPNGIDCSTVVSSLTPAQAKQRLCIPPDAPVIGAAGRLEPVKRFDLFIDAARLIAAEYPETRFLLVGNGREEAALRQRAIASGIEGRFLFLGHRDDIYDVLRAFDLFVLCSDHEGMPMVLLEALWLGIPVVARPVGGVPEVLRDNFNGAYVPSPDPAALARSCLWLLHHPARLQQFSQAARDSIRSGFDSAQNAASVAQLYMSFDRSR